MDFNDKFVPDAKWSISELKFPSVGRVLLYPICEVEYRPIDDPYRRVLVELQHGGLNRNVFLLDSDGTFVWRIQEYSNQPDYITRIDAEDGLYFRAVSFQGRILRVRVETGEATLVDRTKN